MKAPPAGSVLHLKPLIQALQQNGVAQVKIAALDSAEQPKKLTRQAGLSAEAPP